jgi:hypothetical protein
MSFFASTSTSEPVVFAFGLVLLAVGIVLSTVLVAKDRQTSRLTQNIRRELSALPPLTSLICERDQRRAS